MRREDQKGMKTMGKAIIGGTVLVLLTSLSFAKDPGKRSFNPEPPPFDQKMNAEWGQFLPIIKEGSKPGTSDPTYSRTLKSLAS